MIRDFDLYFKKHLTECDLLIYSIAFREGITVTNRLIIDSLIKDYILRKFVSTSSSELGIEIDSSIDEMLKHDFEKLNTNVLLGAAAKFKFYKQLYFEDDNANAILLGTPDITGLLRVFNKPIDDKDFEMDLDIQPLSIQMLKPIGDIKESLILDAGVKESQKTSLIKANPILIPNVNITDFNKRNHLQIDSLIIMDSNVKSLSYLYTTGANSIMELSTILIGADVHHSLGKWYSGISIDAIIKSTETQKFIAIDCILELDSNVHESLAKVMYPDDTGVIINMADVNAGIKRYRLLGEVDNYTAADTQVALADIDDLTLDELDYVILTENY